MIAAWMLYSTVISLVIGVAAVALERAGLSRGRRWAWAAGVILSVAIPAWVMVRGTSGAPRAESSNLTSAVAGATSTVLAERVVKLLASAPTEPLARYDTPFVVVWSAVAAVALGLYGLATWSLARRRRAWRTEIVSGQRVFVTDAVGPAVVGALRPEIVVPEWSLGLPDDQRDLMIEHERQHVRARDPLVLHAAALTAMLMPWNVGLWWLNRRLRLAVELDCDARVLSQAQDVRAYGNLLLSVCARRQRVGAVLAPALFERTSSLTKRVLAMNPQRSRFPRSRFALGAMVAAAAVVVACEMPSPEMLAPDGKNMESKRLYGTGGPVNRVRPDEVKKLIAERFPAVARGEGGASLLFAVRSDKGELMLTESQPAVNARMPEARGEIQGEARDLERLDAKVEDRKAQTEMRLAQKSPRGPVGLKVRSAGMDLPKGIGALRAEDIENVEISKHAAGVMAPNAVSLITITLKPGVKVP